MKRVLVTGGTGFIGRHVIQALASRGAEIEVLVRTQSDRSAFEGLHVREVTGDILEPTTYRVAIERVDHVIHMASLLKMPWSPRFRQIHVEGTDALARSCAEAPEPPCLLLVSSLAAMGPSRHGELPDERSVPAPVSLYGRAKRAAELSAISYANSLPLTIVRPPAVFGPWDTTLLKLYRSVQRGMHLVPGNRASRMSMIQVEDLALAIVEASLKGERVGTQSPVPERGVYLISGDEHPAYGDLGALVAESMNLPPPTVVEIPRFAARWAAATLENLARMRDRPTVLSRDKILEAHSGDWTCENKKAIRELGWRPSQGLEAHLRDTARWYRAQGWL